MESVSLYPSPVSYIFDGSLCSKDCCNGRKVNVFHDALMTAGALDVVPELNASLAKRRCLQMNGNQYRVYEDTIRKSLHWLDVKDAHACRQFAQQFMQNNFYGRALIKICARRHLSKLDMGKLACFLQSPHASPIRKMELFLVLLDQQICPDNMSAEGGAYLVQLYKAYPVYTEELLMHSKWLVFIAGCATGHSKTAKDDWGCVLEESEQWGFLVLLAQKKCFFKSLSSAGYFKIAEILVRKKDINTFRDFANEVDLDAGFRDELGQTITHKLAVCSDGWTHSEIKNFVVLFQSSGVDFNMPDNKGDTPASLSYNLGYRDFFSVLREMYLVSWQEEEVLRMTLQMGHCFGIDKLQTSNIVLTGSEARIQHERLIDSLNSYLKSGLGAMTQSLRRTLIRAVCNNKYRHVIGGDFDAQDLAKITPVAVAFQRHHIKITSVGRYVAVANAGWGAKTVSDKHCDAILIYSRSYFLRHLDDLRISWELNSDNMCAPARPLKTFLKSIQYKPVCSWRSSKLGFLALLVLEIANEMGINFFAVTEDEIQALWESACTIYDDWSLWDRVRFVQQYRSNPDHNEEMLIKCNLKALKLAQKRWTDRKVKRAFAAKKLFPESYCKTRFDAHPEWGYDEFCKNELNA